jgi:hypothetical protein
MTQLWRINLKPGSQPGIDATEFCVERSIVGIGWRVEPTPATRDECWSLGRQRYFPTYKRKWSAAAKALLYGMNAGDLVWTRNRKGSYYLGKIASEWEYRADEEYLRADIINVRRCQWAFVGEMDNVPGSVITSFIPRRTVQTVKEPSALLYSRFLFARLRGQTDETSATPEKADILELLSPEDLEDVAALYLQIEKHCVMFPSTCKSDTMAVECVFASVTDGGRVGLQVKRGSEPINRDTFTQFDGTMYLFQARGRYEGQARPNCICLSPDTMRAFLMERRKLMPGRIRRWLEFVVGNPTS